MTPGQIFTVERWPGFQTLKKWPGGSFFNGVNFQRYTGWPDRRTEVQHAMTHYINSYTVLGWAKIVRKTWTLENETPFVPYFIGIKKSQQGHSLVIPNNNVASELNYWHCRIINGLLLKTRNIWRSWKGSPVKYIVFIVNCIFPVFPYNKSLSWHR